MSNGSSTEIPGYDPRADPDSDQYDPDYDPAADPWNDPDYDPFASDYDPETGVRNPDDPPPDDDEKVCIPVECELVEVEDGWCCYMCAAECSDGSEITQAYCDECDDEASE